MREKEYVMGNNENGGIERFKIEKHGKGLCIGGMLGFVENKTFPFWLQAINTWITGLSETSDFWQNDEDLVEVESNSNFSIFKSVAHRTSQKDVLLYHLWIDIK
jgi:hypothetical protein